FPPGGPSRWLALCRDVTAEAQRQQQLDALHRAGNELANLSPDMLAEMDVEGRIELLRQNIRRFTQDLLHYDVVAVRLLDRATNRPIPIVQEGMPDAARQRVIRAEATDNGVTGYVAATGQTYLCPDTSADPLYLEGASGARSSLTVPLLWQDELIGTFNVESP